MNKSELTRHALDLVGGIFDEYVAFPSPEARDAVVLWTLHTHVYEQFESTPRLGVLSNEPGSGKSRVLELLEHLTPDPMYAVNYHPAVLWRQIAHSAKTTLLLDEVDTVFGRVGSGSAHMSLRSIINAGHRSGATVKRCAGNDGLIEYNVFAPCALAGLGELPETIATRSLIIRMKRRSGSQRVAPFRYRFARAELTVAKLAVEEWAENAGYLLGMAFPEMPVQDRQADVWEPLFAIAEIAGGPWPQRVNRACLELTKDDEEKADAGSELLTDIHRAFGDSTALFTRELLTALYEDPESVWTPELLDSRKLSKALAEYGIAPTTVRRGEEILKGYKRNSFDPAWSKIGVTAYRAPVTDAEDAQSLARYDM